MSAGLARRSDRGSAVIVVIAVIALAAVAFAIYWFALRGEGGTARLVDHHIPAEAEIVGGLDLRSLLASPTYAALARQAGMDPDRALGELGELGVLIGAIESVAFGASLGPDGTPDSFVGVATGDFESAAMQSALAAAQAEWGTELQLASENGVLVSGAGALFASARAGARGQADPAAAAALREIRGALDLGATFWIAGRVGGALSVDMQLHDSYFVGLGGRGAPTHFGLSADIGPEATVRIAMRFEEDAGPLVDQLRALLYEGRTWVSAPVARFFEALDVSASGRVVVASGRIGADLLEQVLAPWARFGGISRMIPATTIDDPSPDQPEYTIRKLIEAALEADFEEGWRKFRPWLHSEQLASPASESSWKTMYYAAFRRGVRFLLRDETKPVFRRDYTEKIEGGRHESVRVFVVNERSDYPKPFHLMRDPANENAWRLNGSL